MNYVYSKITRENKFYGNTNPVDLLEKYESPLYVYNEAILRQRCREMKSLINYPNYIVNYSAKANCNLELLKIVKDEGLYIDAMSPGEIIVELKAGFKPEHILYIGNNVSPDELKYAIDAGVNVSVDSVSQLELYGKISPGGNVVVRFNPGIGAGHHKKVVTAGKETKFGVGPEFIRETKDILKKYKLNLIGINQHIGSLFMNGGSFIESIKSLLIIAKNFDNLEFIDFGGGFGIPYHKQDDQKPLDREEFVQLDRIITDWVDEYGKEITFKIEPGRYIAAECGVLLGRVYSTKINSGKKYAGTDLGFNVLIRPVLYDSHHDIEIYRKGDKNSTGREMITIVGNICESGDMIAKDRLLPEIFENDVIGVMDAGAYGFVMSSNYNNRLLPAEVLIKESGDDILIRKRETLEDLLRNFV